MTGISEEVLPRDFGKYRLVRRLATGGMAEIFLAHRSAKPDEPLVVKRILPHLAESSEFVSMFLDEARIAAQLDHPNIVRIQDVGQIEGAFFISMEYVHGEDIRRIYNRAYKLQRSLPLSHSIRMVAESALGLDYAHELTDLAGRPLGVVHRDVSPQNILVSYDGRVKVVDFGIAKAANKVAQTRAGVLKGKYSYMSPEQALGDPIDHRTDIFALGIILYETTTGTRLFKRGNELQTLQAVIRCEMVPPSEALPGYPADLEEIVVRALAKQPRDRYQRARELADDLYTFLRRSDLYVEEDDIAAFMIDLFADPSLDVGDEPKHELPEATRSAGRGEVQAITAEEVDAVAPEPSPTPPPAPAPGPGPKKETALDRPSGAPSPTTIAPTLLSNRESKPAGFLEDERSSIADGTVPEEDPEDLAIKARAVEIPRTIQDAAPRTMPPSPPSDSRVAARGPGLADDQLPTEYAQPAYRPSAPPPKPTPARGGEKHQRTEQVRTKKSVPGVEPPTRPGPSFGLIGALAAVALVLAVAVGFIAKRRGTPAPAVSGDVSVLTEPNAIVSFRGQILGQADGEGRAGPFPIPPGEQEILVALKGRGFERKRALAVAAGKSYEIEVRARQGFVRLAVVPWAQVEIDGKDHGMTPLPSITVDEGTHRVVLSNPDIGKRHEAWIKVEAGETTDLAIDLQATPK